MLGMTNTKQLVNLFAYSIVYFEKELMAFDAVYALLLIDAVCRMLWGLTPE